MFQGRAFCPDQTDLSVEAASSTTLPAMAAGPVTEAAPEARQRILDTAYALFSRRGVRGVGVDEVVDQAGVAKATLYRHFPSKDELVLAFLAQREQRWTKEWVEAGARRRGSTPEEQLLSIFDLFDGWFQREDFEGCSFINVLLEMNGHAHPLGKAAALYLENIRTVVRTLAYEAGLREPDEFAHSWHILMKGSIVSAGEGDRSAAKRAKAIGRLLIEQHRLDGGCCYEIVRSGRELAGWVVPAGRRRYWMKGT
jgi:AcrR family transcriptional regulator